MGLALQMLSKSAKCGHPLPDRRHILDGILHLVKYAYFWCYLPADFLIVKRFIIPIRKIIIFHLPRVKNPGKKHSVHDACKQFFPLCCGLCGRPFVRPVPW